MRWYSCKQALWLAALWVIAGAALVACSSSSTPGSTPTPASGASSTAPSASGGGTTPSSTTAAAPTTAASGGTHTLPANACALLSDADASQLAGAPVTGHTRSAVSGLYPGGTTAPCDYYGAHGTGDHPVTVWVTSFASASAAHTFIQGQMRFLKAGLASPAAVSIGDEAIEAKTGPTAVIDARVGPLVLTLQGGNDTDAAPVPAAMETAAKGIVAKL